MYPRNATTPPKISIGAVVQISDGAVQTSGVSVAVSPEGGTESAGGGTITYGGSSGIVYYAPTQAETNYTAFVVAAYKTGCLPAAVTVVTTACATAGQVDVGMIGGSAQSATDLKDFADAGYDPSSHKVQGVALTDTCTTNTDMRGTNNAALASVCTETRLAELDAGNLPADVANVKTQTAAIETDTQDLQTRIGTAGAGLTAIGDTRLANLDAAVSSRLAASGYTAPDNANIAAIVADTNELQTDLANGGRLDLLIDGVKAKTDLIPASPAATGDVPTAAAIADAIWDEATADHTTTGSTGKALAGASAPSAASVADAVWDELIADHAGVGSTGAALAAAGGSGDPWSTALPGSYGAGTAGKILGDNLNAAITSRSSHSAADVKTAVEAAGSSLAQILEDTGTTLPGALTTIEGKINTVDTVADAIQAKTTNLPASPAAVGSPMTLTTAYDAAKTAAQAGDAMTLTAAYDAAKTAGDATAANQTAIAGYIDTEVGAVKSVVDKLDTALELDGAVYRLTANALEQSPAAFTAADRTKLEGILEDTGTTIPAQIGGLNNLSATEVNAQCDQAISDAALATAANLATVDGIVDAILVDTGTTLPAAIAGIEAGAGGDATAANQALILEDLEDIKGTGFVKDTNSLVNVTGVAPVELTVESEVST